MVQLVETFRQDEVEDSQFDLIPRGEHPMQVIESSIDNNKRNTGTILTLVLEIIDGPYLNRRIWLRLNYTNENAQAQTISRQTMKSIAKAVGIEGDIEDTEDLHFKPFIGVVSIRKGNDGYEDQNDVRKAKSMSEGVSGAGSTSRRSGGGPIGNGGQRGPAAANSNRPAASRPGPGAGGSRGPGAAGGRAPWPNRQQQAPVDEEIPF